MKNDVKDTDKGDKIPRLILVSGRNEENARQSIEKVNNNPQVFAIIIQI